MSPFFRQRHGVRWHTAIRLFVAICLIKASPELAEFLEYPEVGSEPTGGLDRCR